jgi:UDP-glucose:(heptosyl)LPS alpha-1,3-glucosyltransferase
MVADEFDRYYGRRQNVRVIFNGVDAPAWNERYEHLRQKHRFHLNAREDDVVLICPAKNYLLKGADHAILGFAKWHYRRARKTPTVQLLFVGRDNPEGLQRLAQMHEVGRLVQFLPPTDDIWPWYAAADGVLLLSWYDACSRVVLEAARWGIPSITTQYNGAAEILRDGGGWVIESPKDRQGLWASLDAILDTHQRQRASKACLAQAAGLSMQRHVDELETLYREILGR